MSYLDEQRPVIVEVTTRHVVWVYADSQAEALENAKRHPFYELVKDGDTDVSWFDTVQSPNDQYDWDEVYEMAYGGGYAGLECDAHVDTHRAELLRQKWEAEKAACTEAAHPEAEKPLSDGRRWCPGCREYLPVTTEAVAS